MTKKTKICFIREDLLKALQLKFFLPITNVGFSRKFVARNYGIVTLILWQVILFFKMGVNQLCRQYLTSQKAVDDDLGSTESVKQNIVILPSEQGISHATDVEENDKDLFYRNNLLPNDVARTLEVRKHFKKECKITSDQQTVQIMKK